MKLQLTEVEWEEVKECLEYMADLGPSKAIWEKLLDGNDAGEECEHCGRQDDYYELNLGSGDDMLGFAWHWDRLYTLLGVDKWHRDWMPDA